jgi:hypothetical protein
MRELPSQPLPPAEFMEQWLPESFNDDDLGELLDTANGSLGIALAGEGGGEWLITLGGGSASITAEPRESALFSILQSVEDWRGALWEGRGGAIGKQAAKLFQPGSQREWQPGEIGGPPTPEALEEIGKLDGLIRFQVTGGAGGDWCVDFKLGPGPVPDEPTTVLEMAAEDSEAMDRGELDPMEAFMGGKMLVTGDMALVMQVQAIQMQAAQGAL